MLSYFTGILESLAPWTLWDKTFYAMIHLFLLNYCNESGDD